MVEDLFKLSCSYKKISFSCVVGCGAVPRQLGNAVQNIYRDFTNILLVSSVFRFHEGVGGKPNPVSTNQPIG